MKHNVKKIILFILIAVITCGLLIPSISRALSENRLFFKDGMVLLKSGNNYGLITRNLDNAKSWLEEKELSNLKYLITDDDATKLDGIEIESIFNLDEDKDLTLGEMSLSLKRHITGSSIYCKVNGATALFSTLTDVIETESVVEDYDGVNLLYTYNDIEMTENANIGKIYKNTDDIQLYEKDGQFLEGIEVEEIQKEEEPKEEDRNSEELILKEEDKGLLVENVRATDLVVSSVEAQLSSTGVAPFNQGTGVPQPGMDYSPDDEYVRTYDDLTYDVSVALNGSPNQVADVEVTMTLPQANSANNLEYRWDVNSFAAGDYQLLDNGETIKFFIRDLTAGQLFTKAVILKVYNAPHGSHIRPQISAKVVGSNSSVNSNTVEEAIVSGAVRLNTMMWACSNNKADTYNGQNGRYVLYEMAIESRGYIADSRKGISFPVGEISLDLDLKLEKRNISTGQQTVIDHEAFLTEYGDCEKYNSLNVRYHGSAPYSRGSRTDGKGVYDSGVTTITKKDVNSYNLAINDYKISDQFPERTPSSSAQTVTWKNDRAIFYSEGFTTFVPYLNDSSGSYDLYITPTITSIHYTDSSGNVSDYEVSTSDNMVTIAAPEYLPGSYSISTNFLYENGSRSSSPDWYHGNSAHMRNENIWIQTYHHYGASRDPFYGGLQSIVVFDGRKFEVRGNPVNNRHDGSNFESFTYWFGVGTITDDQVIDGNYINKDLFEWYPTLEEAKAHETDDRKISAVGFDIRCELYGPDWPLTETRIPVKVRPTAVLEEVIPVRSYAVYYRDKERTNPTPMFSKNKYVPSKYDENNNVMAGTHSPSNAHGGNSLKVISYKVSITKSVSDLSNGKPTQVYNLAEGNEVNWVLKPSISVPRDVTVNDPITITDIVPAGLDIVLDSFNVPYTNIEELPDGSKKITWVLDNYNPTTGLPQITYKTTIPLTTADRTQFETSATIEADGDGRPVQEFKTSSYGISIINDASFKIVKNVNKEKVEIGEDFKYTLTWSNNSNKDYTNGVMLDILPYNGNIENNFHGSYTIKDFKVPNGSRIYYTTKAPNTIIDDPINSGVTDWKPLTKGVTATALKIEVDAIASKISENIEFTLQPTDNLGGDLYYNNFRMGVQGMVAVLSSNIVRTEVIARTLEGTVWFDTNNDGLISNGEDTLENVTVTLLDGNGNPIPGKVTTTDANGHYLFDNLPIGDYKVQFELPGGTISTIDKSITDTNGNHTSLAGDKYNSQEVTFIKDTTNQILNAGIVSGLGLEKSSDATVVYVGEQIDYTIKVFNRGTALTGRVIDITDQLPAGLEYVDGSSNYPVTKQGNTLTWSVDNIPSNGEVAIRFKARVTNIDGDLTNTASLHDNLVKNVTVDKTSNGVKVAKIEIEKSATPASGSIVFRGDTIRYELTIRNTSDVDAVGLRVSDLLPNGTVGQDFDETITVRANSSETLYYEVKVDDAIPDNSTIRNRFRVNYLTSNEVTHVIGSPRLEYSKEMNLQEGELVNNNSEVIYKINVRNTGDGEAFNVLVEDTLNEHLAYVENSSTHEVEKNGNKLKWVIDKIRPNETVVITFKCIASKDNQYEDCVIPNTAKVNNNNTNTVTFEIGSPELRFSKKSNIPAGEVVYPSETIEYILEVENISTIDAKQVVIEDIIGEGLTGTNVIQSVDIDAGQVLRIPVTVAVDKLGTATEGEVKNKFTVDGEVSNEIIHPVRKPNLEISKSQNFPQGDDVSNRTEIEYTITVKNTGRAPAFDVKVEDTLDSHLKYIEAIDTKEPTIKGQKLTWILNEIQPNEVINLKFKVLASKSLDEGRVPIVNKAFVDKVETNETLIHIGVPVLEIEKSSIPETNSFVLEGDSIEYLLTIKNVSKINAEQLKVKDILPSYVEGENVDEVIDVPAFETKTISVKTTVKELEDNNVTAMIENQFTMNDMVSNKVYHTVVKPRLEFNKSVNVPQDEFIQNDSEVTYTIAIKNTGTAPALNVEIKDLLSKDLEFVANSSNIKYEINGQELSWVIDKIEPEQEVLITFNAIVHKDENLDSLTIPNVATVNGKDTNTVVVNIGKPGLKFEKYSDPITDTEVKENDTITYTIKLTNNGTVSATDVEVKDTIPSGTSLEEILDDGVLEDNTITWNVKEVKPNEEVLVRFRVKVSELDKDEYDKDIINIALVDGTETNEVKHYIHKVKEAVIEDKPNTDNNKSEVVDNKNNTAVATSEMLKDHSLTLAFIALVFLVGVALIRKR